MQSYDDTPSDAMRFALKPVLDIKIADNIFIHIQDYLFKSKDFYINNLVVGLAYKVNTDFGLWVKPFMGSHYQESTYYDGFNGYMLGWVLDYRFSLAENTFSLSQWHETTFDRDPSAGYDGEVGQQGAISLWWHPHSTLTTGVQYRYASDELGTHAYHSGLIYSLKYNF